MQKVDYLAEIQPQSVEITLSGQPYVVERARLKNFFLLDHILNDQQDTAVFDYVVLASGLDGGIIAQAVWTEAMEAFYKLRTLNSLHVEFPFLDPKAKKTPLDYEGRILAVITDRLARAYGWSRDEIWGLYPEEAMFYLLEILIAKENEREWQYNISGVGYDKKGAKQSYQSQTKGWRWNVERERKGFYMSEERARDLGLIPCGDFIDLTKGVK